MLRLHYVGNRMTAHELVQEPIWRDKDLGRPLPDSTHAVSVALPRWQDVVGYEEKRPEVMSRLHAGYPRFVVHPLVLELARRIAGDRPCLPFPSFWCADQCAEFIQKAGGGAAEIREHEGVFGVVAADAAWPALRAFWQHTGLIVPTRQAEAILAGQTSDAHAATTRASLRRRLAGSYECAPDDVFLAPTGMAAQYAALRAVTTRRPGQATAQLGFPYVDTLKLQQKFGHVGILLHNLDTIAEDLHELLSLRPLAACFCEIPGNPLLGSADVRRISPQLRRKGVPLVADDVVATSVNVDLGYHADLIATSLTKFVAGTCDVMGGALICPPRSPFHAELKAILRAQHEELMWGEDARALDARAVSFPHRMHRHNEHGLFIAERLRTHPAIERVWYPKWEFNEVYEAVRRRPHGGWGSLITFLPKNAEHTSPLIYDRLEVCKGPSLGTVFTIACPFTLLAHYTELEWAESCGVPRHLIRLSVGLEDPQELWQRIERALDGAAYVRHAGGPARASSSPASSWTRWKQPARSKA